jgi:hypothetical protein
MSDTTQLAVQAIEGFLKKQVDLTYLSDFDEAFRGREQRLPNRELQNPTGRLAWLLYDLCRNHFFLLRVESLKLAEIARGILWALQNGNPANALTRQRNDLMHELAHIELKHVPARVDFSKSGLLLLSDYSDEQEQEADWHAAARLRDALTKIGPRTLSEEGLDQARFAAAHPE